MRITWDAANTEHITHHGGSPELFEEIFSTATSIDFEEAGHGLLARALGADSTGRTWCAIASYHVDEPDHWLNPITMYPFSRGDVR